MKFQIVDAFTRQTFGGNPAGVVLLPEGAEFPADETMRKTAAELRYSETAFIKPLGGNRFHIRYFTPAAEVELCGHATIGSFHALQEMGLVAEGGTYIDETLSGTLEVVVGKDAILAQVEHCMTSARRQQEKKQLSQAVRRAEESTRKANPEAEKHLRASRAEEGLLGLLILNPDYIRAVSQKLPPEEMVTAFNRTLYVRLMERHRQGLLTELAFLAADYDADEMAYISHMVQAAREGAQTPEQAMEYAAVIRSERSLAALNDPSALPDDRIFDVLAKMREQKK